MPTALESIILFPSMVAIAREYAAEKEGQLPSDSALVQDCRRALRSSESEAWGGLAIAWEGGNHFFPVVDGRQNIVGYLNTGGNWKQTVELDAFGNTINDSGTVSFPFGYKGYFRDLDTGMYYLGHRYYNPLTGRFLNRDPIREAGGLNLYAHTANDHINRWDFLGLSDADQYEDAKSGDHLQRRSSSFLGFDFTLYGFSHGDWLFRRYHAQNRAYENWLGEKRIPIHIGSGTLQPNFRNPILRHSQQAPGGSFDGLRAQGEDGGSHNFNDLTVAAANHGFQLWFSGLFEDRMSIITQEIIYPSGADLNSIADGLYDGVRNFAGFNEATNFYLVNLGPTGVFGADGQPATGAVMFTDRPWARTLTADTASPHFLTGTRQWTVLITGPNTITLRTAAYERFSDPINAGLVRAFSDFTRGGQHRIWTDWFDSLVSLQVDEHGAEAGDRVFRKP